MIAALARFRSRCRGVRLQADLQVRLKPNPTYDTAGTRAHTRLLTAVLAAIIVAATVTGHGRAADGPLSVRITSPLGRTGTPGAVRIVARIEFPTGTTLLPVRFLIDGAPYKIDDDGPPYAVEWVDENPFDRHEISVEVEDSAGRTARDQVVLEPFELTDQTEVFGVLLEAAVRDRQGRFISGLDRESFSIAEDGKVQTPDLIKQEAMPATFTLLVDSSHSMLQRLDFVRAAAGRIVKYLRPLDRVIVAPFSRELAAFTGPTGDRETVMGAIGAIRADGGTAIADALEQVADRLSALDGRRVVILITDGYDEHSTKTLDDAVAAIKKAHITVYVVGIGGIAGLSTKGSRELRALAAATGGRAFFPPRIEQLADVYDQLALDAQNRYLLTYTPLDQRQDGTWRKVSIATASPDYVVTTRDGYFAPKAPPIRPMLEFAVTDLDQRYVDITRDDLIVVEDGVEQQVDTFQIAVDPIQIVLTLDESGSMRRATDIVKAAARDFVQALEPKDPLAVITFADKALFAHDLTTNRQWSFDAIDQYRALGGTALYDALYNSLMRLKPEKGRRAVIVMTDGRDENNPGTAPGSVHTLDEVIGCAKDVDAAIFAIGLGPTVDRALLTRLAQISGGNAFFPTEATGLKDEFSHIVENLRRRYVLGYSSTNGKRDGAWRAVEIKPRSAALQVSSRGGYFAPEK